MERLCFAIVKLLVISMHFLVCLRYSFISHPEGSFHILYASVFTCILFYTGVSGYRCWAVASAMQEIKWAVAHNRVGCRSMRHQKTGIPYPNLYYPNLSSAKVQYEDTCASVLWSHLKRVDSW